MLKEHYEKMLPGARLWTGDMEVEMDAIEQIRNVTQLPILAGPVVVMPDVHLGRGARRASQPQARPGSGVGSRCGSARSHPSPLPCRPSRGGRREASSRNALSA